MVYCFSLLLLIRSWDRDFWFAFVNMLMEFWLCEFSGFVRIEYAILTKLQNQVGGRSRSLAQGVMFCK